MDDETAALVAMRKDKDEWLKRSPHSPIEPHERPSFKGLRYFDPDPKYRVVAAFEPAKGHKHVMIDGEGPASEASGRGPRREDQPKLVRIGTSTGEFKDYHEAGKLRFTIDGAPQALTAYVQHGREDEMFVPFRDATSGKETYGAARYLEAPTPAGSEAILDFNYAYNPYCAYSEAYSCPLPPQENWLKVPIHAGERSYKDE